MYSCVVNNIFLAFERKYELTYNKTKENEVILMKPTSIRLSDSLYEKVKNDADKEKRSITKQIEYILERYYGTQDKWGSMNITTDIITSLRPALIIPIVWLLYSLILILMKKPQGKWHLKRCIGFCVIFGLAAAIALAIISRVPSMIVGAAG